jgi:SAM-dependent methyltransferase
MSSIFGRIAHRFFAANTKLSLLAERRLGWESDKPFWAEFGDRVGASLQSCSPGDVVVDLGGGRRCVWVGAAPAHVHLVAVDIDPDELAANTVITDRRVGDVGKHLPFEDGEATVIVSRALLEHVADVPHAVSEMARVLRPGGKALHFVPARNSLFGVAARLGPFGALKRIVHLAIPGSRGQVEFPVHYDHGTAGALETLFTDAGFSDVKVDVCYSQSGYFHPVFPIYLLVAAYQGIVKRLGARQLAAYLIVDATR